MFDLKDTEVIIPLANISNHSSTKNVEGRPSSLEPLSAHSTKSIIAFPAAWVESFGGGYYEEKCAGSSRDIGCDTDFDIHQSGVAYDTTEEALQPTEGEALATQISALMETMKQGDIADE